MACLTGCYTTGTRTEAQQLQHDKNVAALKQRGWSLLDFLGDLTANVVTNTATNFATERFGGTSVLPKSSAGFRK